MGTASSVASTLRSKATKTSAQASRPISKEPKPKHARAVTDSSQLVLPESAEPSEGKLAERRRVPRDRHRKHRHHRLSSGKLSEDEDQGGGGKDGDSEEEVSKRIESSSFKQRRRGSRDKRKQLERVPSTASMSASSVGSYAPAYNATDMSGFVWLYAPSSGRLAAEGDGKEEPPRRVWMEARLTDAVLVWVDASGQQALGPRPASGIGSGAGSGQGEEWWWGAARNSRLQLSQIRSMFPGRHASAGDSPEAKWRGSSGRTRVKKKGGKGKGQEEVPDTPYTFTVVTWGASLVFQAPNAYEFVGWLATLRSGVHAAGGGVHSSADFQHPAVKDSATAITRRATFNPSASHDSLFRACVAGDVHSVRYLLRDQPEMLHSTDVAGDTALIVAARSGAAEVVRLLLRRGADASIANLDGQTALIAAAGAGRLQCVDAIIRRQRKAHSKRRGGIRAKDKMVAHQQSQAAVSSLLDHSGLGGLTAAHAAAAGGFVSVLELLLVEGANPFVLDDSGWTVAHYAARCSRSYPCIALLCDVAVDLVDWWDTSGNTPLHIAASGGWAEGVQLLLQTAANPHAMNIQGMKPTHLAESGEHSDVMALLDDYRDSTGLVPMQSQRSAANEDTSIDRIMMIWDRFFANAIANAERGDKARALAQYSTPPLTTPRRVRPEDRAGAGRGEGAARRSGSRFERAVASRVDSYGRGQQQGEEGYGWQDDAQKSTRYDWETGALGYDPAWKKERRAGSSTGSSTSSSFRHPNQQWGARTAGSETTGRPSAANASRRAKRSESKLDVWEAVWDDGAQAYYYYNHRTEESVWQTPTTGNYAGEEPAVGQGESWARAAVEQQAAAGYEEPPTPPMDAWEEHYTEDGTRYFYNRFLGESTWERPRVLDFNHWQPSSSSSAAASQHFTVPAQPSSSKLDDDVVVEELDAWDESQYWQPAAAAAPAAAAPAAAPAEQEYYGSTTTAQRSADAWSTEVDDQGNEFYYNLLTGETQWPEAQVEDAPPSTMSTWSYEGDYYGNGSDGYAGSNGYAERAEVPAAAAEEPASEYDAYSEEAQAEWEECYTPEGVPYWYNASTGESVWA